MCNRRAERSRFHPLRDGCDTCPRRRSKLSTLPCDNLSGVAGRRPATPGVAVLLGGDGGFGRDVQVLDVLLGRFHVERHVLLWSRFDRLGPRSTLLAILLA